jgi:hypothetical protein
MMQWGFLDDKLIYGDPKRIIDKTYWEQGSDQKLARKAKRELPLPPALFEQCSTANQKGG